MKPTSFDAIVIQSFGGPEGMDDVMPFLRNVTRGRNIPDERLKEVAHHYELFGGVSPINEQNRQLISALKELLEKEGPHLPVYWGNRNWAPYLKDTFQQMKNDGVRKAVSFATAAYASYSSCKQYLDDIDKALAEIGPGDLQVKKIRPFFDHPLFIGANAEQLNNALRECKTHSFALAFSAHSIPLAMADGCQYKHQLMQTGSAVAEKAGQKNFDLIFQSRSGPPTQPWLEPDVCDYIRSKAEQGIKEIVVQPIGFVSDHMEVVYDLDTEAKELAQSLGVNFIRAKTAGNHPLFIAMIRDLIVEAIENDGEFENCPADCCPSGRPQVNAGHPGSVRQS